MPRGPRRTIPAPLLDVSFGGSFSAGDAYTAATGETMAGALTRRTGAESIDAEHGAVLHGGADGLAFVPAAPVSGGRLQRPFVVEAAFTAIVVEAAVTSTGRQGSPATVLAVGGALFARYAGNQLQYGFSVLAGAGRTDVSRTVAAPAAGGPHVLSLAYEPGDGGATLHAFLDGDRLPDAVSTARAASWAPGAPGSTVSLGNEVSPGGAGGLAGSVRRVRLAALPGPFTAADLALQRFRPAATRPGADTGPAARGTAPRAAAKYAPAQRLAITPGEPLNSLVAKASALRPSQRQLDWQRLGRTAFLHFGMNTFTGQEWGTGTEDPDLFAPRDLDTDQWARTLRDSGFELAILVVKHHDGFVLYPSRHTGHSVASSAWRGGAGDVLREFVNSMHSHGLKAGVYLSPADENQYHDGVYANGSARTRRTIPTLVDGDDRAARVADGSLPTFHLTADDYGTYMLDQLYEVLTEYGPIDQVWFDGAPGRIPPDAVEPYDFASWYSLIRSLAPRAVISVTGPDVRWVGNENGVARQNEWSVLPTVTRADGAPDYALGFAAPDQGSDAALLAGRDAGATELSWWPAECDVSLRDGWFFHPDQAPKSVAQLVDLHHRSVGRNAVLLLNVPPDTDGRINAADGTRLAEWQAELHRLMPADLARGARVTGDGSSPGAVVDGRDGSDWTAPGPDTGTLTLTLPAATRIERVVLAEDLRHGQQLVRAVLEEPDSAGGWSAVATVGTVGARRIVVLDRPIVTDAIRLRVLGSRAAVHLHRVSLYCAES
ncbi:alpha-L-fucosidase [Actinocatenispora sera]|uniref:alpha-L-fucosidase n=1 Tax=Actinocatenispora sera TaxID=390989 RepID=UPI00340F0C0C